MKHNSLFVQIILLCTILSPTFASPETLLNYTFPGKNSSHPNYCTAIPASQTSGDFIIEYSGGELRNTCVRLTNNSNMVSVQYAANFQEGDIITLTWASKGEGGFVLLTSGDVEFSTTTLDSGSMSSEIVVGNAAGQWDIAGKSSFSIKRGADTSVELNTITIVGEPRETEDPSIIPTKLLDYTFPGKNSSHSNYVTSLPVSQTRNNFIISFSEITDASGLRGTCVRLHQNSSSVRVTYRGTFLAGDSIILNWTSKEAGTNVVLTSSSESSVATTPTETTGDVPLSDTIIVGSAEGQLNITGHTSFEMKRGTTNSVELRSLVIIGVRRDIPEQEQLTVEETMTWDWTYASTEAKIVPPSATDTLVLANIDGITDDYSTFDARYIVFVGENAVRNGKSCQVSYLMINLARPGHIKVTFCNVGNNKGDRYLFINGESTGVYSIDTEDNDPKVVEQDVPAGELVFTAQRTDKEGNQAIRIMRIEYTPFDRYKRNVTAGRYGTLCLERAGTMIEGATLYRLVQKQTSGSYVTQVVMEEVTTTEAGKPYIILPSSEEMIIWQYGDAALVADNENGLYGSFVEQAITAATGDADLYIISNNQLHPTGAYNKVGAHKAYIKMSEVPASAPAPAPNVRRVCLQVTGNNTATNIDNDSLNTCTLHNKTYDILGRETDKDADQITIINGKKTLTIK